MPNSRRRVLDAISRRRTASLAKTSFCETCGEVCTPACQADTHRVRSRDVAVQVVGMH